MRGLFRVVIHNRFKFAQNTFYDKNINSRSTISTRTKNEIQQLVETELFSHFKS